MRSSLPISRFTAFSLPHFSVFSYYYAATVITGRPRFFALPARRGELAENEAENVDLVVENADCVIEPKSNRHRRPTDKDVTLNGTKSNKRS